MKLWTEYEGNTIAGAYTLGKLQRSEGRNAFFLTENEGKEALLRITEALNDEAELIARWKAAAALEQPNLLKILACGRAELDAAPLAWALLERTDSTLLDVLKERNLTPEETTEVAIAVAGALQALHAAGLIHEHVEPSNVFAVGEVVKLRSDCVRECTGEFENDTPEAREALRQRDVHDFGLMLARCLSPAKGDYTLPSPFDRIVAKAIHGTTSFAAILDTLAPQAAQKQDAATPPQFRERLAGRQPSGKEFSTTGSLPVGEIPTAGSTRSVRPPTAPASSVDSVLASLPATPMPATRMPVPDNPARRRIAETLSNPNNGLWWCGGAIAAALLGVILWNTGSVHSAHGADSHPAAAEATHAPTPVSVPVPRRNATAAADPKPSAAQGFMTSMHPDWHVIAYTYNYEEQARAKVLDLQKRHFSLRPQVFTPTGGAPYFVALGDGTGQDQASARLQKARRAGLPRDTYIRAF